MRRFTLRSCGGHAAAGDASRRGREGGAAAMKSKKFSNRARHLGRLRLMLGVALTGVAGFSSGTAEQTLTTLHSFTGGDDGARSLARFVHRGSPTSMNAAHKAG